MGAAYATGTCSSTSISEFISESVNLFYSYYALSNLYQVHDQTLIP